MKCQKLGFSHTSPPRPQFGTSCVVRKLKQALIEGAMDQWQLEKLLQVESFCRFGAKALSVVRQQESL